MLSERENLNNIFLIIYFQYTDFVFRSRNAVVFVASFSLRGEKELPYYYGYTLSCIPNSLFFFELIQERKRLYILCTVQSFFKRFLWKNI